MGHRSWNVALMEYGNVWKHSRRLLHEFMNARAVKNFDDYQHKHSHRLLLRLAESPGNFADHIELWVFSDYLFCLNSHSLCLLQVLLRRSSWR